MPYLSKNFPFLTGQDEATDEKLLPDGPLRSVENFRLERNVKMSRRQRLASKEDNGSTELPREFVPPSAVTLQDGNRRGAIHSWAQVNGEEVFSQARGNVPAHTSTTTFYPDSPANLRDGRFWSSSSGSYVNLAGSTSAECPNVVQALDGTIVWCYTNAENIVFEFREPKELRPLGRAVYPVFEQDPTAANVILLAKDVNVRLVASTATNSVAAVFTWATVSSGGGNTANQMQTVNVDVENQTVEAGPFWNTSAIVIPFVFAIDAIARPGGVDNFVVAYADSGSNLYRLDIVEFQHIKDGAIPIVSNLLDSVTPTGSINNGARMAVSATSTSYIWTVKDDSNNFLYLRSGTWSAPPTVTSSIDITLAPVSAGDTSGSAWMPRFVGGKTFVVQSPDWEVGQPVTNPSELRVYEFDASSGLLDRGANNQGLFVACGPLVVGRTVYTASQGDDSALGSPVSSNIYLPSGRVSSFTFNSDYQDESLLNSGTLVPAGANFEMETITVNTKGVWSGRTPPLPLYYTVDGEERVIYPVQAAKAKSDGFITSVFSVCRFDGNRALETRGGETVVPGAAPFFFDGARTLSHCEAPYLQLLNAAGSTGTARVAALIEYTDANGRLWRGPVSPIVTNDATINLGIEVVVPATLPAQGNGANLVIYATEDGGTVLYRVLTQAVTPSERVTANIAFGDPDVGEILYTQLGDTVNDPPPACRFMARSRGRVWAAGLERGSAVQASKTINEIEGIAWSDLDSFKVFLPGECTGLAAMDDTVVAFTKENTYLISGAGPNNAGVGTFSSLQTVPGRTGCIQPKSVVSDESGVFFQSKRGIEFLSRGFAAPVWIGQSVRDTLQRFPHCLGGAQSPVDKTIRWIFSDSERDPTDGVIVVWDSRAKAWYVHSYEGFGDFDLIGTNVGVDFDPDQTSLFLASSQRAQVMKVEDLRPEMEATNFDSASLTTGSIRTINLQGWAFGRRVHLLGEWGGRPCGITLAVAFDDKDFLPQDQYTWNPQDEFEPGVIELEMTLPVQQFSSLQLKLTVDVELDGNDESDYSFKPNGYTVYYSPAPEGPRLAVRSKA